MYSPHVLSTISAQIVMTAADGRSPIIAGDTMVFILRFLSRRLNESFAFVSLPFFSSIS